MTVFGFGSAASRRAFVAMGFAAVLGTAVTQAQQAPAPAAAPAQAPAAPADPFKFTTDAGGFLWQVKPEKAAEFEAAWKEIRSKLIAATQADVKELGMSIRMYKIAGDPGPQGISYLFVADPASKTLSYSPSPFILFESKLFADADARRIFETLQTSSNGINPLSLSIIPAQ
jgi:hypothetical protein